MKDWQSWGLPLIATVTIALVPVAFGLSKSITVLQERVERLRQDLATERERNDHQDQRQTASEILLGKIDSKLDYLKEMLERRQP